MPEKIPYAIDRHRGETARLWGVLAGTLAEDEFIAGSYPIADIADIHGLLDTNSKRSISINMGILNAGLTRCYQDPLRKMHTPWVNQ